jgi:hypothetical protein
MTFTQVVNIDHDYPLFEEDVDLSRYNLRQIHKVYHQTTQEMEILVINFAHRKYCAIPSTPYVLCRARVDDAKDKLIKGKYIELEKKHYHNPVGKGRPAVYKRTAQFESTFKFKLPKRIVVTNLALNKPIGHPTLEISQPLISLTNTPHSSTSQSTSISLPISWHLPNLTSGICLKNYEDLAKSVQLSMSDNSQVFKDIWLVRHKARLYQRGTNNYQQMSEQERSFILIDGKPTIELDYSSLHPNMLINSTGVPCPKEDIYTKILDTLGVRKCKKRRRALKLIVLIAINITNKKSFSRYIKQVAGKDGVLVLNHIPRKPMEIYNAIVKSYPALKQYVCTGKYGLSLQQIDSGIMIDILETLAIQGVIALPVHDSIIVPKTHEILARQIMVNCYKKVMGFNIRIK